MSRAGLMQLRVCGGVEVAGGTGVRRCIMIYLCKIERTHAQWRAERWTIGHHARSAGPRSIKISGSGESPLYRTLNHPPPTHHRQAHRLSRGSIADPPDAFIHASKNAAHHFSAPFMHTLHIEKNLAQNIKNGKKK